MAGRIRALDWGCTPLGPVERWPGSLRTAVEIMLASPVPTSVMWGPTLVQLYNDAYVPIARERHPEILGRPALENWAEARGFLGPILHGVLDGGDAAVLRDQRIPLRGSGGGVEERVFTGTFSVIRDESGAVGGVFHALHETTATARAVEALRESEERHRLIVEGARDYAILTTDPEGRIESWAPGAEAVFGWSAAEAVGHPVEITFTREDRATGAPERERREARAKGSAPDVRWHLRRDGSRVFIDGVTRLLVDGAGGVRGFLKVGQDVTERRRTTEALRESEERFRTLVQNIRDYAIFMLNADGVITGWTEGAERVKGYAAEEVLGRHVSLFYTPEQIEAEQPQRELAHAGTAGRLESEGWRVRAKGERYWANEIATAVHGPDGRVVGFTRIIRDLTAWKRAQEELRELNETLERRVAQRTEELAAQIAERERAEAARREVFRQLVTTEEEERRRLSRELHDQMGQQTTALLLGLKALEREADPTRVAARIAGLQVVADRIVRDLQHAALELRPPALDNLGLAAALQGLLEEWSDRAGIEVDFHAAGLDGLRLPREVETTLYRVVQEGLTNVLKHAQANRVSLLLERRGGTVRAILEDDGRGFEVEETLASPDTARRLGVRGMRERVALLGGEMEIESTPGSGTTLFVRVPERG